MLTSLLFTKVTVSFFCRRSIFASLLLSGLLLSGYSTAAITSGLGTFTLKGGAEVKAAFAAGDYKTALG